ncbi:tetratricopeptide repeat protein [Shimia sp.]|uniref:tetratricopeptide repeat protein n=1 Tax=Shimia sp. TaxID=1954381 RepID=UPI00329A234D
MNIKVVLSCVALASFAPAPLLAAGSDNNDPPQPTQTTKECKKGKVWSDKKKRCVNPENSELNSDTLYDAVRELAYAGRLQDAQRVLKAMPDQNEDRVLTYWGFTHRNMGDLASGMSFYEKALNANPDNLLARSYKGQAHIEAGDLVLARAELLEIRERGGEGTWPEVSLATAIRTGVTYNF